MAGGQEKSEKPTGKKLSDSRSEGKVAKSRELGVTVTCLGGSLAIYFSAGLIYTHTRKLMNDLWGHGFQAALEGNLNQGLFLQVIGHFFLMLAPTAAVIILLAIATDLIQIRGFLLAWDAIKPKFSNINPVNGFKNFFSPRSLVELVKSLFKLGFVGYIAYYVLDREQHQYLPLINMEIQDVVAVTGSLALEITVRVSLAMFFLSILDYSYQRWQYTKDLMMTKQEVKEEHKQSEGNPQIKSKIRALQRALARQRMMAKVPQATVVITNPTHYAVALIYDKNLEAPQLVAKGKNLIAKKIMSLARKHRVPIVPNPPLARALYQQVDLDGQIPVSLYRAVAKVLAYVFQQRQQRAS
jgi:flagellar biosynthesis protein FlhB